MSTALSPTLTQRTSDLVALFDNIARTRMAGLPMVNTALTVQAVGFSDRWPATLGGEPLPGHGWGVLVSPWFMNLLCIPVKADPRQASGRKQVMRLGSADFEMISAYEEGYGAFSACSLFSPMFEFAEQSDAVATANAVLAQLRAGIRPHEAVPARRAFFLGRASLDRKAA